MIRYLLTICLSVLAFIGYSQQFHFKQYSLKEGLSRSGVYDIHQDKNGFVWVATEGGGLCKFDGKNFKTYTRFNGLASEKVRVIFEDSNGILWLGTTSGLNYYDGHSFHILTTEDGISDNFVRSISEDSQGNIWIGTNRGISIIDANEKGVSRKLKVSFSLPHKKVRSLNASGDIMWIGTDDGLCKYQGDKIEIITTENGLSNDLILCLFTDSKNNVWAGTENGLNCLSDTTISFWNTEDGLIANRVRNITEDHLGNIWIGTSSGISVFNGKNFLNIDNTNGLPNDRIRSLAADNFNNIWVGTYFGGVMRFNHRDFIAYTPKEGLVSNQIFSIAEDEKGDVIVGTFDGVSKLKIFNNKLIRCKNVTDAQGLKDNSVHAVLKDANGYYWYGTQKGVTIINNNRVIYLDESTGLENEEITVIREFNGTFWVGTSDGLAKISTTDYKAFEIEFMTSDDGLAGTAVSEIRMDTENNIWVAFSDGQLTVFESDRIINPPLTEGAREILSLTIDSLNHFWIGTNGNGLFHGSYIPSTHQFSLKNLSTADDLSSNYIFSLLLYENTIWIGHENGLDLLTPETDSTFEVQSYGPERGFFGLQNNQNASYADKKGNLWFGTVNGLFCLKHDILDHFREGKSSVNYIQSVKVNGEFIDWEKSEWNNGYEGVYALPANLTLPYNQNNISFEFVALNYISPSNIKYSWKLEGLEDEWNTATYKDYTTYTNLFPGNYTFLLRSSNEHGVITGEPVAFEFTIEKPWWSTWAIRIIGMVLIVALILLIMNLRTRQLRSKQRSLERTINERTTEITRQKEELEIKNGEITDSILYSRRIQHSILPGKERLNNSLKDHFIFYKPKDIVSGDFYWVERDENSNSIYVAVADCTGHGVPGAMVSLVGTRALNSSVRENRLTETAKILDQTNEIVLEAFTDKESGTIIKDGMDIALCALKYEDEQVKFQFSGAHNPVWIVRAESEENLVIDGTELEPNILHNGFKLFEIKGNKQPIGYFEKQQPFTNHSGSLKAGDRIYLTSDGYADQFGGENGKKFKYKALKTLILEIQNEPFDSQRKSLMQAFFNWKGDLEQLDDVCLLGFEI